MEQWEGRGGEGMGVGEAREHIVQRRSTSGEVRGGVGLVFACLLPHRALVGAQVRK